MWRMKTMFGAPMQRKLATAAMGLSSMASLSFFSSAAACAAKDPALSPQEFRAFQVRSVESLTHNTKRIVFDLPTPEHEMGLTVASCLVTKAVIDGKAVIRPYTPTNLNNEKGFLELVVKGYPSGTMSKHITELQVGDALEMKGPFVKFEYKPNQYKRIGLIAGGSGLTPMLQVAKEICRNQQDKTEVVLLFANQTEDDIILRDELDAMQYMYPQFKVVYVLSKPPANWKGYSGHVTKEMIQELMPTPSDDHLVCVCGPPGMMNHLSGDKNPDKTQGELTGLLKELGYTSKQVYKF